MINGCLTCTSCEGYNSLLLVELVKHVAAAADGRRRAGCDSVVSERVSSERQRERVDISAVGPNATWKLTGGC